MSLYIGQNFTLILTTGHDLTNASVKKIRYRKPDGTSTGEWTAASTGKNLTYDVQTDDIDVAGKWEFEAYAEDNGAIRFGTIVTHEFFSPIPVPAP